MKSILLAGMAVSLFGAAGFQCLCTHAELSKAPLRMTPVGAAARWLDNEPIPPVIGRGLLAMTFLVISLTKSNTQAPPCQFIT